MNDTLAEEIIDDQQRVLRQRLTAWGTSMGTVLSMCVLTVAGLALGMSANTVLVMLLASQALRCAWLFFKKQQALRMVCSLHDVAAMVPDDGDQQPHPAG